MKSELLYQVLEISKPWQVVDVSYSAQARQIDVYVARTPERSSWFSRPQPATAGSRKQVWRHVNFGHWRCFIHLDSAPPPDALLWSGGSEMPFTHALARQVQQLLTQGLSLQAIGELLDLQFAELWKFKHTLDSVQAALAIGAMTPPAVPLRALHPTSHAGVPDVGAPIWEMLLGGAILIDIRFLSLKLLLTKLRKHASVVEDSDVRRVKVGEIHRYFSRYGHMLEYELAQLHAYAQLHGQENDQ
jgi:hypothetical protein